MGRLMSEMTLADIYECLGPKRTSAEGGVVLRQRGGNI